MYFNITKDFDSVKKTPLVHFGGDSPKWTIQVNWNFETLP